MEVSGPGSHVPGSDDFPARDPPTSVLYLVHEFPPIVGGAGTLVAQLAETTARVVSTTIVTCSTDRRTHVEASDADDLLVVRLGSRFRDAQFHYATTASLLFYVLRATWRGWIVGRRRRITAIHAYYVFPAGFVAILLGRLLRAKVLVTAVGAEIHDPAAARAAYRSRVYRGLIRWILRRADHVSAISSDMAARTREYCPEVEVGVLSPGIHLADVAAASRDAERREQFVLCSVSRLAPRKGIDATLRAIASLGDPSLRYVVVGDGRSRPDLESLAAELGIEAQVEFRGFVEERVKHEILAAADVFVLPSLHEGFGLSYVEAMDFGLPVIAPASGGQADFVEDGRHGILLQTRDVSELVAAIRRLRDDAALRDRIGGANRERAREYSWNNLAERYLRHYIEGQPAQEGARDDLSRPAVSAERTP